jgi:hypothetical protein
VKRQSALPRKASDTDALQLERHTLPPTAEALGVAAVWDEFWVLECSEVLE